MSASPVSYFSSFLKGQHLDHVINHNHSEEERKKRTENKVAYRVVVPYKNLTGLETHFFFSFFLVG
jgi:hypothetical protein